MYLIRYKNAFLFAGALALVIGCASMAPIQNYPNQPISTNRPVSLDEIGKVIRAAGASLKMDMQQVSPGVINATYVSTRERTAVIEVRYDTKQYSITYKDSQGLAYDGKNIMKGYNGWVENLDKSIRAQLSAL